MAYEKLLPIFQMYLQQNPCVREVGGEKFFKIHAAHISQFFPISLYQKYNTFIWQAGPSIGLASNFSNLHRYNIPSIPCSLREVLFFV